MGSLPKDVHADSAAVVLSVLLDAVRTSRLEPPAVPEGTHDIDLWLADDRKIAVEVTRIIDGALVAQVRALPAWLTTNLRLDWMVILRDEHVQVKGRREVVEEELAALEANMPVLPVTDDTSISAIEVDPLPPRLASLGVDAVSYFPLQRNGVPVGQVQVRTLSGAFGAMEDAFPDIEQAVLDNLDKLRRAGADERHLFIWVSDWHSTAGTWKFSDHLPARVLNTAEGVDAVWIAPMRLANDLVVVTDRVWCFRLLRGWAYEERGVDLFRALDARTHLGLGLSSEQHEIEAARAMLERMRQIIQ
jgi:hypothetical protein